MQSDEVKKEPNLFDYLSDIGTNKQYLFDEEVNKNYVPFMINRGFGQHIDTILLANEMNKRSSLSKLMHHDFLFYAIDKKKRYGKWAKSNVPDEDLIEFIRTKYSVNYKTALMYVELYDKQQLKQLIKEATEKGGKQ